MGNIDKRNLLDEEPFSYQLIKDQKVHLFWEGKPIKIIKDEEARKFLAKMSGADTKEQQLIMAKLTGNFKRGNEKNAKLKND